MIFFTCQCWLILLIINFICLFITKVFSIGFITDTVACILLPTFYGVLCLIFSILVKKRVIWFLPFVIGLFYFILSYPRSMYGQDLVIEINCSLSGIFNILQFVIQRNGLNGAFEFYFVHIFCLVIYLIVIMKLSYYILINFHYRICPEFRSFNEKI